MRNIHSLVPKFLRFHPVFLPLVVVFAIKPWFPMFRPIEPASALNFWLRAAVSVFWVVMAPLLLGGYRFDDRDVAS